MGKLLVLVLILFVVYALWRASTKPAVGREPPERPIESMVCCAQCDVHLPRGEALQVEARFFCSREHASEFHNSRRAA